MALDNVHFRRGVLADAEAIVSLMRSASDGGLDRSTALLGVSAALNDDSKGRYYVATEQGVLLGAVFVTVEWSDWRNWPMWWIQQALFTEDGENAVKQDALFEYILRESRAAGVQNIYTHEGRETRAFLQTCLRKGMTSHYEIFQEDLTEVSP